MKITGPIPENIRKCMTRNDRRVLNAPTNEESKAKYDLQLERQVHKDFQNWCNRVGVIFRHQRTDKKTSEQKGWPDFQCMKAGKICFVEFKLGANHLSPDQVFMCNLLIINGFHVLITDSYSKAAEWVTERLF